MAYKVSLEYLPVVWGGYPEAFSNRTAYKEPPLGFLAIAFTACITTAVALGRRGHFSKKNVSKDFLFFSSFRKNLLNSLWLRYCKTVLGLRLSYSHDAVARFITKASLLR